MIRTLTVEDSHLYFDHLIRVYNTKGLLSVKDADWVENQKKEHVDLEKIETLFSKNYIKIWAEFDNDGNIVKSIRTELASYFPHVRLINFKSELTQPFSPVKILLPLLGEIFTYYESQGIYNFYLMRRVDWFDFRRNKFWEDNRPLNRYNSYFDQILEPGEISSIPMFRDLAGNMAYPVRMGIVKMSLKQEYRSYGSSAEVIYPDTKFHTDLKNLSNSSAVVIGSSTGKIGEAISNELVSHRAAVTILDRSVINIGFETSAEELLSFFPADFKYLSVILNLYDHAPGMGGLQEHIFDMLWDIYKDNPNVQIVVIGSMAHYFAPDGIPEEYTVSKRRLRDSIILKSNTAGYRCKLILAEPGVVDNYLDNKPQWAARYIKRGELAKLIVNLMKENNRFMLTSIVGSHLYLPA